jgi:hypothetical protein
MGLMLGYPVRGKAQMQARVERRWGQRSGIEMRIEN